MPIYRAESSTLQADGPTVTVQVGLTNAHRQALTARNDPVPPVVQATALIDTGASGSVVQAGLLAPLGLNPVGVIPISTPTTSNTSCAQYAVQMIMPHGFIELTVIEAPLQGQNIQALIGRDVLRHCLLIYDGVSQTFTWSY